MVKTNMDISNEDLKARFEKKQRRWACQRILSSPSLFTLYHTENFCVRVWAQQKGRMETYCPRIMEARAGKLCSSQIVIETMAWIR